MRLQTMLKQDNPMILEVDLTRSQIEVEPDDPIGRLRTRNALRWRTMIGAIHDGASAPAVRGLMVTLGPTKSLAHSQELRDAVAAFRTSGKPTLAWADSFGELGSGLGRYYLACAFEEIWLHPAGTVAITGLVSETPFVRRAIDKLGVTPEYFQRYEFKGFADTIMASEMSAPLRENLTQLVDSTWTQIVPAIAAGRGLDVENVPALIDAAPYLAKPALAAKLVDSLGYHDEAVARIRERADGATLRYADQWTSPKPISAKMRAVLHRNDRGVALVEVTGNIVSGRSRHSPTGSTTAGDTTVVGTLLAAARNDKVGAVVVRVDSGGGSALASDTMWHGVRRVREAGKPVIVSMGSVAASGGYYIACGADVIVADAATLTGSIGVAGGKFVMADLFDRIGFDAAAISKGEHAEIGSLRHTFSDSEVAIIDAVMDGIYLDFASKVAEGRGLTTEQVDGIARGRVWTGAAAKELGLVDELGGLRTAIGIARSRAGLRADAAVRPAIQIPMMARLKPPQSSDDPRSAVAASGLFDTGLNGALSELRAALPPKLASFAALVDRVALLSATDAPQAMLPFDFDLWGTSG